MGMMDASTTYNAHAHTRAHTYTHARAHTYTYNAHTCMCLYPYIRARVYAGQQSAPATTHGVGREACCGDSFYPGIGSIRILVLEEHAGTVTFIGFIEEEEMRGGKERGEGEEGGGGAAAVHDVTFPSSCTGNLYLP